MTTISRVYDTHLQAQAVVNELVQRGVPKGDISLIGHNTVDSIEDTSGTATGASIGGAVGGGAGLLAGLGMLAIPGVGPVVAAGWLAATLAGAAAGAASGGLIGALTDLGTDHDDAHVYAEAIRRGGTLVTVRTADARDAEVAMIMDHQRPVDVIARRDEYRTGGWEKFNPDLPAYNAEKDKRSDKYGGRASL